MNRDEQKGSVFREGGFRNRDNRDNRDNESRYFKSGSNNRNNDYEKMNPHQNFGQDEFVNDTDSFRNEDLNLATSRSGRDGQSGYSDNHGRNYNEEGNWRNQQVRQDQVRQQYIDRQQNYAGMGPKGYRRSDERIEEEVCNILMRDKNINASQIEVQVHDGVVRLNGMVDSRSARFDAEMAVDGVPGVEDIQNDLKVRRHN